MNTLKSSVRLIVTLAFVCAAFYVGRGLWVHYMDEPWTRDARLRADVVGIAPDVSGLVSEVDVQDNQRVKKGDVLFRVDRERFNIALAQAEAALEGSRAAMEQAHRERERQERLGDAASLQQKEQARTAEDQARAAYGQALANRDLAKLNLDRSEIKATVNGTVSNLSLRPGDYVTAGTAKVALVDTDSLRVEGYFEETKLPRIHVGDTVSVRLMGQSQRLQGHIDSIATGIEDRERTAGTGLLANINPTFSWVRLAQRVPVRINLDNVPGNVHLIAGLTATVEVREPSSKPTSID
ncbi:efflux RND transporter periplasmic adaptor subunit [Rhizobium ruizarguesonis]|jgi:RND family efflux transporter MFP subunit|uniref:efflux RND transporter periplasmic adaptor subunit n=1 Tax=Rhizobium ruizarguesonis TaxID=2081791 RepID=UPI000418FDE6|nr:HlyD family secretion protein [Rhizobium ruizarguesonis]MBY5850795.1 HlyD family secretion protein [Rhizobium leguminosarum]NKL14601.1 efflux RND transporter periplasmic adaptor subunit [Rhizobium leguminosarum bv. viciae]MBY5878775.1 HlyD family secretion protein [Rhizobium leguminosarum]NEJ27188.1 efflux RND transporter periplasmic adaptor subunit [Rhizobium ruizarguesonis]NKL26054.1 efflux RND transporter periplasmic adaptor subunit [Rhizobium leguminosarum bv. viciae]